MSYFSGAAHLRVHS